MSKISRIIWGIVLIALGFIFLLNALEITKINIFFNGWWTLLIIIPCLIDLINPNKEGKMGDIIGILIGIILLLLMQRVLNITLVIKLFIPAIFLIGGLYLVFGSVIKKDLNSKIKDLNTNKAEEFCSVFSSQSLSKDDKFKQINLEIRNTWPRGEMYALWVKDKRVDHRPWHQAKGSRKRIPYYRIYDEPLYDRPQWNHGGSAGKVRAKIWVKYRLLGGPIRQSQAGLGPLLHRRKPGAGLPHPHPGPESADPGECGHHAGAEWNVTKSRGRESPGVGGGIRWTCKPGFEIWSKTGTWRKGK